jgi:hypothetical protein
MTAFAGHWPADSADHNHVAWVPGAWNSVRPLPKGNNYLNFQTRSCRGQIRRLGAHTT